MPDSECRLTYSTFCAFVECSGQPACHRVTEDHYLSASPTSKHCYEKEGPVIFLCDHCLAFWWECVEHRERSAWQAALFFRDLFDPANQLQLAEAHTHLD